MWAHFDCFSGISGDMTLGALVDLGVPVDWLRDQLRALPLAGIDLSVRQVSRAGVHAHKLDVHAGQDHPARSYADIRALLERSALSAAVKSRSLAIFERLALAEACVHACPVDQVHFHEVGGLDAIADIVGTVLGLAHLGIERLTASHLPLGSGFVTCRHGRLPVPAPATLAILKGVPVYGTDSGCELVTPTGAAIIATLVEFFGPMPDMVVGQTGYGAGDRDRPEVPNLLRIVTGRTPDQGGVMRQDDLRVVEACIDDMNPEILGYLMEQLFEDGALDVCYSAVMMKKNRPGTLVQVICEPARQEVVIRRILSETTSLGVRYHSVSRRVLPRASLRVATSFGEVQVKRVVAPDGQVRLVPEYEVCRRIARESAIPIQRVYDTIQREARAAAGCERSADRESGQPLAPTMP